MMRGARLSFVLVAAWGCSDTDIPSPTSPSSAPGATYGLTSSSSLEAASLTGVVTDTVRGGPIGGITVEIPGVTGAVTNGDGIFNLSMTAVGEVSLVVRGDDFYTRETHAMVSPKSTEVDILPMGSSFDLDFFDHVFRFLGEDHTYRWTVVPRFEIWTGVYDLVDGEFFGDFVASDDTAPERFTVIARDVIAADTPKYTGGFIVDPEVVVLPPHPAGTRLTYMDYFKAFTITVLLWRGDDYSFGPSWPYETGRIYSAAIWMQKRSQDDRQIFSHELAHTLGFFHPEGSENVPRPSIMRDAINATSDDILHGRILYHRPPGSRTADVDPEDFILNALRTESAAGPPDPSLMHMVRD